MTLRGLRVRDVGGGGNEDGIKLSGVSDFVVEGCTVERWGAAGSAIDLVGCHRGVIRGNVFRDIAGTEARFQNAVYLDDMASGIAVEDNVFLRCNLGVLVGGGRDVRLFRNAFISCGKAVSWDARGVGWMAPHLVDPGRSTILKAFRAMPVGRPPWSERYPRLAAYATDRPGRPAGGELDRSMLVATPLGRIDDRECVREDGTMLVKITPEGLAELEVRAVDEPRRGPCTIGPAALGPVGPRPRD